MNAERRKYLSQCLSRVEDVLTLVETARDEEQDYYDNMPESLQGSDKGDASQTAIDALESAVNSLEEARDYLSEATQ